MPGPVHAQPRAHPRAGGENISGLFIDAAAKGSSPRGRGKPGTQMCMAAFTRLIPARAGKTHCADAHGPLCRAHPRAGGENCERRWQ